MKPDRILLAELRAEEAFDYLRNVNSGHPGSITSVHATSAELAFEQLVLLVKQSQEAVSLPGRTSRVCCICSSILSFSSGSSGIGALSKKSGMSRRASVTGSTRVADCARRWNQIVDWSRAMLTAGWSGLAFGYAVVAAPMLSGMIRARATFTKLLLAPLLALPVTGLAACGIALASPLTQALGMASNGVSQLLFGAVLAASAGYFSGTRFAGAGSIATVHQRGALIMRSGACARSPDRTEGDLKLAGTALAFEDEVKHFKFIGTTGTGKSTAIHEVLRGALARGDRAVIADPEGGYLARFYERSRGDVILNPFESRSVKWDLFGEIRTPYDIDQLARALIPDEGGADRAWRGYARTFFSAVARQAHGAGVSNVGEPIDS